MEAFHLLILMANALTFSYAEPILVFREEINGQWRESVVIPCSYTPSTEYEEEMVTWSSGGRVILRLENPVEHVYLSKHRGRLSLSRSHPGDVSLRINNLQMDDKGQYNCGVVWRSRSTNGQIQKDATTKLNIIRVPSITRNPKFEVINTERPGPTAVPSATRNPGIEVINTQRPEPTAVPSATRNPGIEVINTQRPGPTAAPWARAALGIPLYLLILICVLCIAVVGTIIVIVVTKRGKKQSQIYEVPNMNLLLARADDSPLQANGCRHCEEPQTRKENEYQVSATATYEQMVAFKEPEYEFLIPEKEQKD